MQYFYPAFAERQAFPWHMRGSSVDAMDIPEERYVRADRQRAAAQRYRQQQYAEEQEQAAIERAHREHAARQQQERVRRRALEEQQRLAQEQAEVERARQEASAAKRIYLAERERFLKEARRQQRLREELERQELPVADAPAAECECTPSPSPVQTVETTQDAAVRIQRSWRSFCACRASRAVARQMRALKAMQAETQNLLQRVCALTADESVLEHPATFTGRSSASSSSGSGRSDASTSPTPSVLLFTTERQDRVPELVSGSAQNRPFLDLEETLVRLLTRLDAVLSGGSAAVRAFRRELVAQAQRGLQALDDFKASQYEQCSAAANEPTEPTEPTESSMECADETEVAPQALQFDPANDNADASTALPQDDAAPIDFAKEAETLVAPDTDAEMTASEPEPRPARSTEHHESPRRRRTRNRRHKTRPAAAGSRDAANEHNDTEPHPVGDGLCASAGPMAHAHGCARGPEPWVFANECHVQRGYGLRRWPVLFREEAAPTMSVYPAVLRTSYFVH